MNSLPWGNQKNIRFLFFSLDHRLVTNEFPFYAKRAFGKREKFLFFPPNEQENPDFSIASQSNSFTVRLSRITTLLPALECIFTPNQKGKTNSNVLQLQGKEIISFPSAEMVKTKLAKDRCLFVELADELSFACRTTTKSIITTEAEAL